MRLVVPLTDLDHLLLARRRDELGGAVVLVPEPRARSSAAPTSTWRTSFFEEHGIGSPPTWLPDDAARTTCAYPVLVKARGASARATSTARETAPSSISSSRYTTADSMVQSVCRGEEFSVDVFCDLDGRCLERSRER